MTCISCMLSGTFSKSSIRCMLYVSSNWFLELFYSSFCYLMWVLHFLQVKRKSRKLCNYFEGACVSFFQDFIFWTLPVVFDHIIFGTDIKVKLSKGLNLSQVKSSYTY